MAIDFTSLVSTDVKRQMLEASIQQLIQQGYQHEINRRVAQVLDSEDGVTIADQYLTQVEAQLQVHQEELDALN